MNDISERQEVTRGLAREYDGVVIPFQSALNKAAENISPHKLLEDGVDPTDLGHHVLADCWIEAVLG